jgi:stage II sporulation protein D
VSGRDASSRMVRVALAQRQPSVRVSSDTPWRIFSADGLTETALTQPGERWVLERDGALVSARRDDSRPVSHRDMQLIVRPSGREGTISFNGRRWRGDLTVVATAGGLLVVNGVSMDDYVKGVVPLEIGTSAAADVAAIEAQAVAARSYAITHLAGPSRPYDMVATVADQVYGGATAESGVGNQAVDATAGLVLQYDGRVVNAPYHATCGGSTAEPQDVWRTAGEPYLRRVSDQIPGTARFYCDQAPRFRWTRTFDESTLRDDVARYVARLASGGSVGTVRDVRVATVTPAGRVTTLAIETDGHTLVLRGNEMRDALRSASGELLYSTYFSVETVQGRGTVQQLTLRGGGNGHGIGMCQSGAIGRARAGQDFRTILSTYYPGTTVARID